MTLGKLHGALGQPIGWGQLDRSGLTRFERHLRRKLGNAPNTVLKDLARLRRVARQAVKDGALRPDANPFLAYDMPKGEPVDRRRLTQEELAALAEAELPVDSLERATRDLYLLSCYAAGLREELAARHLRTGRESSQWVRVIRAA